VKVLLNIWSHLPHLLHGVYELIKHPEDAKYLLYGAGAVILLIILSSIPSGSPATSGFYKPAAPIISVQESAAEKKRFKIAIISLGILLVMAIIFFMVVLIKRVAV
jgi:hypothetical protein